MKKKFKNMLISLAGGLAVINLFYTFYALVQKEALEINFLYAMDLVVIVSSVIAVLLLKQGVAPLEKWIRRGVIMLSLCIITPLSFLLCGCLERSCGHTDYSLIFKIFFACTPAVICYSVFAFLIGDMLEKKHLEKINKKFSETSEGK